MDLHQAASYFDNTVCADAYNNANKFLGQLDLYDDSKRDGVTVERRILSVAPSVTVPARRAVRIEGDVWIVGQKNIDSFQGSTIRHKYVLHQALTSGTLRTPKQKLTTGGVPLYSAVVWIKDSKDVESSSRLFSFMNAYFAAGETVVAGDILTLGADNYRIRNVYESAAGLQVGEASTMPRDTLQSVSYSAYAAQTYNATLDTYDTVVPTVFNVLWERFQDSYHYESVAAPKYEPGDILMVIEKSQVATPQAGDTLVSQGVTWRVVSFQDDMRACWEMQVRRA